MKKVVAAILMCLILPSICFAQRATDDVGSTGGVDRHALTLEIGPLRGSAALEFRHCTAPGNVLMAGIGAGIGALVGVLVSRH